MLCVLMTIFNIFAFFMYITFIFVVPRLTETLHPGSGGNPAFNIYDVDDTMRPFFYAGVVGWILTAMWIVSIRYRFKMLQLAHEDKAAV